MYLVFWIISAIFCVLGIFSLSRTTVGNLEISRFGRGRAFYGGIYCSFLFFSIFFLLFCFITFYKHFFLFGCSFSALASIFCLAKSYRKYAFFLKTDKEKQKEWILAGRDKIFQETAMILFIFSVFYLVYFIPY